VADQRQRAFEDVVEITDIQGLNITALTGVAGGGKTFSILKQCQMNSLLLSSTRRGREELLAETKKKRIDERQVRTLDSYLMMNDHLQTDHIVQDECYQQHFGFLMLAVLLASGNRGRIKLDAIYSGDVVQVPFINRTSLLLAHAEIPDFFFSSVQLLTESYRSPADVMLANVEDYRKISEIPMVTNSLVRRSLDVQQWTDVSSVPRFTNPKTQQYITLTHVEQKELVFKLKSLGLRVGIKADEAKGIVGVNVPGEIQGMTKQEVAIVRQYDTSHIAYQNSGPNLVAITRHTHRCTYFTVTPFSHSDLLLRKVKAAIRVTDDELDAVMVKRAVGVPHKPGGKCGNCGFVD